LGIKAVADLLVELSDGSEDNFCDWGQQLELLQDIYRLNDDSVRILMGLRKCEKAAKWFNLKPDHLRKMFTNLLDELQRVFSN
jgi:hypothetical protein